MAKYCPIAKKITNCTDNCASCLEEENALKVGSRVRYIHEDSDDDKESGFYPPIGTLGTITYIDKDSIQVKWDEGTEGDGIWWCELECVEEVTE